MKKEEMIRTFANKMDITHADSVEIINNFLAMISDALVAGESVTLHGIGTLSVDIRPSREMTLQFGSKAGEKITIPDKRYVKFSQSGIIKNRLAGEVNDNS